VHVASEASDIVTHIRFVPGTPPAAERTIGVGAPGRILGPHGLVASADGRSLYVALAHARPSGRVVQIDATADTIVRSATVGASPETMSLTPDGKYLYVTNRDAPGARVPASVSIIFTPTMTEIARPTTCVDPHGGRIDVAGLDHYSVCETSDQLVQIDTRSFLVTRRLSLVPGAERLLAPGARGTTAGRRTRPACAPRWAEPRRDANTTLVYVSCSATAEVLEIDATTMQVRRRIATSAAPDRIATDPAGRVLLVTFESSNAIDVIDPGSGTVKATITTSDGGEHQLALSADGRFAFITNAGTANRRGSVDIVDMGTLKLLYSVYAGYGAGAISVTQMRTGQ
jgi:DNA-binding beta-propeller fold protein YncE